MVGAATETTQVEGWSNGSLHRKGKAMHTISAKLGPRVVLALTALVTLVAAAAPRLRVS
jgi:hypothetical protein